MCTGTLMAIWGLFSLPGDEELCFTLSNGSKAAEVEMSTRVLIKVSWVWICKVLGLRSNHRLLFFSFFLKAASKSPSVHNIRPLQTRASCRRKKALFCFPALEFPSNSVSAVHLDMKIANQQATSKNTLAVVSVVAVRASCRNNF